MTHKLLMVIPNTDMRDLILDVLEDHFKTKGIDMVIDKEETFQDAVDRSRQSEPYRLIISYLHIAKHRKAPLVEEEMLGLSLFRELSATAAAATAGILLTPIIDNKLLGQVRELPHMSLVSESDGWQEQICEIAEQIFASQETGGPQPQLKDVRTAKKHKKVRVDIYIGLHKDTWQIVFNGDGGLICDPKPRLLRVDMDKIHKIGMKENWVYESKDKYPMWVEILKDIGEELAQQILINNPEALRYYKELNGEVGGCEHFSLRFITSEEAYPLPLEAILAPEYRQDDDFWMLKSPMSRRVDVGGIKSWPLFENPESEESTMQINCLIIEADVHGYVQIGNQGVELKKLNNVAEEADQLERRLREHRSAYRIGRIKRIPDKMTACTRENVEAWLTNGEQWHLVHYAGHSLQQEKGFVFFPHNGMADAVNIQDFSQWLRVAETRLIYLSSCQSSKVKFAHEMARIGVPAAIGFRWDIDDQKAAEHADTFYDNLFRERSLEYAFLKTRQQIQRSDPEHIIWAAPVLMMQAHR
jgi:hypothetical protein